jgi:hypothetical protein
LLRFDDGGRRLNLDEPLAACPSGTEPGGRFGEFLVKEAKTASPTPCPSDGCSQPERPLRRHSACQASHPAKAAEVPHVACSPQRQGSPTPSCRPAFRPGARRQENRLAGAAVARRLRTTGPAARLLAPRRSSGWPASPEGARRQLRRLVRL